MGVMSQNQLFQEQERPLVVDLLSNLNRSLPHVLRGESSAVGALSVGNDVLDLEDLLEDGRGEDLQTSDKERGQQEEWKR